MAGTALEITVDSAELAALSRRLNLLSLTVSDRKGLLKAVGSELETQTRRRLSDEKEAPAGTPWPEWSDDYAATRHGGHSLLQSEGDLLDSITYEVSDDRVEVGTNLIYGAIHQFGGDEVGIPIPPRPYLGLSRDNRADLEAILEDWGREALRN